MSERQIDPTPILILFRMLFNDGQLKCLEENADNSIIFSNFYKLIYKVRINFLSLSESQTLG